MTWLFRFGAFCAVLSAFACTGNPKPLPPNNVEDANTMQDAFVPPQDANVSSDSSVYVPDAALDAGPRDAMVDGGDAMVDGGDADSGLFVPDGGLKEND